MSALSDVIVRWIPETSGRVATMQIRHRPVGVTNWTEDAARGDPAAGEFRIEGVVPGTNVEVQTRYTMVGGIPSPWTDATVLTAPLTIYYASLSGVPTSLSQINGTEGGKLGGIQSGATVGATSGLNLKDSNGNPLGDASIITGLGQSASTATVGGVAAGTLVTSVNTNTSAVAALQATIATINANVTATGNTAQTNLNNSVVTINAAIASARADASSDLQTTKTQLQSSIDGVNGAVTTEAGSRYAGDSALNYQINQTNSTVGSNYATIQGQIGTLSSSTSSLASQTSSLQSQYNGVRGDLNQWNNDRYYQTLAVNSRVNDVVAAYTGADQAFAGQLATYNATFNGLQGTVSQQASAIADAQGRVATSWQVIQDVGGGTARMALTNTNGYSNFLIDATNILFNGNVIVNGSLTTTKVADSAITKQYFAGLGQEILGDSNYNNYCVVYFHLDFPADIIVIATGSQNYYGYVPDYQSNLYLDGQCGASSSSGAGVYVPSWALSSSWSQVGPGDHVAFIQWRGGGDGVHLSAGGLTVLRAYK